MVAEQRQKRGADGIFGSFDLHFLSVPVLRPPADGDAFGRADERRVMMLRGAGDDITGFVRQLANYDGPVFLDDARLFRSDFFERVAEILLVVETDGGDDGNNRRDDIRRVKPSAHSGFDDGDLNAFTAEMFEGQRGRKFEKSDVAGLGICDLRFAI
jgi:hypothetical protein